MSYGTTERDTSKYKYILYARKSSEAEDRQVASIESQVEVMQEVAREFGLNIIEVMTESASGFHVGRPVFNEMMDRIESGYADGIISWKLSRLSRNPDDAGRIMGMLQRSQIKHIRTVDRNWFPEDNVMMMYVEFGLNNQYSRDLSTDTRRGLIKKAERGWSPQSSLPLGYIHSPYKKLGDEEIIPDPERFDLVQEGMLLIASNRKTPREALRHATTKGLRSRKGNKISYSVWYRLLADPFYYGEFDFPKNSGKFYEGKHKPMLKDSEYEQIQVVLGRKDRPRPKRWFFPYTGMMKCGECGCSIVADPKKKVQKNGNIHKYTYYRCTKKRGDCNQKCTEVNDLEEQFTNIIEKIDIPQAFHEWAIDELKADQQKEISDREQMILAARQRYDESLRKLDELVEGWLDKKVPEDIYNRKLPEYEKEKKISKKILDGIDQHIDERIQKLDEVLRFAVKAQHEFEHGDDPKKKEIIAYLGSNLVLKDRKLTIEIKKPLRMVAKVSSQVKEAAKRFEPLEKAENTERFKAYLSKSDVMGGEFETL